MTVENDTRVALVSGSSRGIGLQIARQLAERGDRVIVTARDEHAAERVAGELAGDGLDVISAQLDVTDQASVNEEAAAGVLVNALNPGWVRTDMGGAGATRSVEEGADTAVWLATLPHDGATGGFFKDREPIPW